ncbi:unnamed protein product [Nippostrongylus brasiliensis]|uniref:Secreted protein n=1 Tax=Nippostrongylus brasiliensis TaxID=27835 RepID=A0A0N4YMT3_NIPBR|nr:hypothetical protein Q1695_001338 [Nippostrongylus brasiliensis]VDL82232.1 unnamed protein product [Nippostrongylus brasiliensis]
MHVAGSSTDEEQHRPHRALAIAHIAFATSECTSAISLLATNCFSRIVSGMLVSSRVQQPVMTSGRTAYEVSDHFNAVRFLKFSYSPRAITRQPHSRSTADAEMNKL